MKKILLSSDCNGNFQVLFTKVNQLNIKTQFDIMFIVGNVCPLTSSQQFSKIIKQQIKIPIPTYFINNSPMSKIFNLTYPQGHQFAENFHFLGKSGIKNIQGLNVCYINGYNNATQIYNHDTQGLNDKNQYKKQLSQFDFKDIDNLLQKCNDKKIDILLTNQWPLQIMAQDNIDECKVSVKCNRSALVSKLSYSICPKYHISSSGRSFWRLDPFLTPRQSYSHFINIAQINPSNLKDKYLLAIQTIPLQIPQPEQIIMKSIQNPFKGKGYEVKIKNKQLSGGKDGMVEDNKVGFRDTYKIKRKQNGNNIRIDQNTWVYFYDLPHDVSSADVTQFMQRWGNLTKIEVFNQKRAPTKTGLAKFSTVKQTQNCIADSGNYSIHSMQPNRIKFSARSIEQKYRNQDCWFCQKNQKFDKSLLVHKGKYSIICVDKGPISQHHFQILPINHVSCLSKLQPSQVQQILQFKKSLTTYFLSLKFQVITYQRSMKLSQQINHYQFHLIAIKSSKSLLHRFQQTNKEQRINFVRQQQAKGKSEFFVKIQINQQSYIRQIFAKQKIDVDFVRKTICQLLNTPTKIKWRDCQRTQKQLQNVKQNTKRILKQANLIIQQQ